MYSDVNGCSTCSNGTENYETFKKGHVNYIQYDYRNSNGQLFSCVAINLQAAREKRDYWIKVNHI
jgi:hypothetical protein